MRYEEAQSDDKEFYDSSYDNDIITPETQVVKDFNHDILWIYGQPFMKCGLSISSQSIMYDLNNSETYRDSLKKKIYCYDDFKINDSNIVKVCKKECDVFHEKCINGFNGCFLYEGHHMTKDNLKFVYKPFGVIINCRRSTYNRDLLIGDIKIFNINAFSESYYNDKRYVSAAYYCKYLGCSGMYRNEKFDVIQTDMVGDHVACVRMGIPGAKYPITNKVEKFISKPSTIDDYLDSIKYTDPILEDSPNVRATPDPVDPPAQLRRN